MTEHDDRTSRTDYLWDPNAPADADVVTAEQALRPLRFDSSARPLSLTARTHTAGRRIVWRVGMAIAASILLLAGVAGFLTWRLTWPNGRAWSVTWLSASASANAATLEVDRPLQGTDAAGAHVEIARVGSMDIQAGTDLMLSDTRSRHHRMLMTRGTVDIRVWAPPGVVALHTPAGDVIDLGCVFRLVVDDAGSHLHVQTGWVQLDNIYGESLVPGGTSSSMDADHRPLVPVYDDAAPAFHDGIRAIERSENEGAQLAIAARMLPDARRRDVITLLVLSNATDESVRRLLLERAAQLMPPPPGVTVEAVLSGDRQLLWNWYGTLDLPKPKSWWRNWRDALPWPFASR